LIYCLKVLDSELKAYSGIVKNLGKEAEKLKKTDPENAKEIAAEQVDCSYILLYICIGMTSRASKAKSSKVFSPTYANLTRRM